MASVNPLSRELVFKIVYYGPGLGGKTTTLEHIHATAKPEHRGKLVSLATPVDRTLYFDFLPVRLPPVRGMHVRLQLFTVPGQVYFNATRKLVLTGADGVVFVSDSQVVRADANLESLENLRENLSDQGRELATVPLVFQHNKRDLPDLLPVEELDNMLNPFGASSFATSATSGAGVYEALERISERVLDAFKDRLPELYDGAADTKFAPIEGGLVHALRDATARAEPPSDVVVARIGVPDGQLSLPPTSDSEVAADAIAPEVERSREPMPRRRASPTLQSIPSPLGYTPGPNVLPAPPEFAMAPAEPGDMAHAVAPPFRNGAPPSRTSSRGAFEPVSASGASPASAPSPAVAYSAHGVPSHAVGAPHIAASSPAAASLASPPTERHGGISFAELWPESERATVRDLEDAITRGRYWRAIELCDALVSRVLANAGGLFGTTEAPRDPAVLPMLLGLDGRRYLAFRSIVREARDDGLITAREALSAYAFAVDCRLARSSIR